ncbi:PREDICTED: structural maintenance of chromosomes protein 1A-like [Trachymyrmex septentrionalis]|uniref:structural maintenance of chromosomes protein 1A-like n=1 Tax=Trachymyrmex septentrionalis TaxID=34720 RepID=UPI00084ED8DD|nr:PREDICTED: structural maintenance of chromosomes protein 1A-like [Trachymyrmex septentrionalis]
MRTTSPQCDFDTSIFNGHLLIDLFVFDKCFTLTMSISLNRIVIFNFKSFGGETVIGPIQPFTAIIGLNGAGKSNIVDAISFALGEGLTALRVKYLSELIYGISTRESMMERAMYVKLIFNINAVDGIKKKSFTRAVRGGTYQYKIDNKIVTNICYMTELREMGLDIKAENFLIPQGYISCVAMKKPKDLAIMFEKITDSNKYKADYDRRVEFLQDKERKIKSQIDQYLHDKKNVIILLEDTKSQFKSLSSSLEDIEQDILKMKNIIEQRKTEHIIFKDKILYWQKKRESARISLDSANKARDANKKIIQELNNELERINNELTELRKASQTSTIELSNSQVKRYMELTNEVEFRAQNSVKQIKSLMHDQREDQAKLDNENRCKEELEDKEKQMILKKVNLETRFTKLQDSSTKSKTTLMEKIAKIQELNQTITETRNKSLNLENDIVKITEELSEADIDKNNILYKNKKNETINMLKQIYSGVYGRLFDLCKPIHSRYNVAVTKVFGQYMNAIVVDTTHIAIHAIEEPQNVKLLYDVLNILSPHINNAILFVTKNTLVCETSEHARMLAYPDDKREAYDCVSLDGCFYRKKGLISGGLADLTVKAKQWDEQRILTLMEQKVAQLMQELRNLPKISLMQSEVDIINIEINALARQNKYVDTDIKDAENEIVKIQKELDIVERTKIALNNEIFADFCNNINVPDISYYEKNNLRIYQEKKTRQLELEQQYNRIKDQLGFENENDIENKVLKWQQAIEHADTEWKKMCQQERHAKIKVEQKETKMSRLKDNYTNVAKDLEDVTKKLAEHKSQINVNGKLYLESQKAHIAMEDISIPMSKTHCTLEENIFTSSSSSSIESSGDCCEILTKIDFSQFPKEICNFTNEQLRDMSLQLFEKITEIENEFDDLVNLKVDEKIDIIKQRMQKINTNLRNYRNKYDEIKMQFESVKAKRYKLFSDCLERVTAEIDLIYKNLVNNTSAQAIILSDNPEEPYASNIIYNCIAPHKGFQPLQYLSDGEKSMASLALLFAIQRYRQIPFFIMDEGDAALDKVNIKNVVSFIRSQATLMQFITISLHKELYRNSDALVGVTVESDISYSNSQVFAISLNGYCKSK